MRIQSFIAVMMCLAVVEGCATTQKTSIDRFVDAQEQKISKKDVYQDALLVFWAAAYQPTLEDIQLLKAAWSEHTHSFPESRSIIDVERALQNTNTQTVLISLYTTENENADLKSQTLGWAVGPLPQKIVELDEKDVPLRALMPVTNAWARIFLVTFDRGTSLSEIVVSNKNDKVSLQLGNSSVN